MERIGLLVDVMQNAPELDRIFLLSGDADLDLLTDTLPALHEMSVGVCGVLALSAHPLIRAATAFRPITELLLVRSCH